MINIKHNYQIEEIIERFLQLQTTKKTTRQYIRNLWNQYQSLAEQAVEHSIIRARKDQIQANQLPIPWDQCRTGLGHTRSNIWYWNWFHTHFPFFRIIKKGQPGTLTMVELLHDIEIAAASRTPREAFLTAYQPYLQILSASETEPDLVDWAPIDLASLDRYIRANTEAQTQSASKEYLNTLKRNIIWAQTIRLCAEYTQDYLGQAQLPQIVNFSKFGRRYYSGLNLQNCPKIVRLAALGHCWEYDLEVSVFAWRYHTVKMIRPDIKFPFTLEYIDEKSARRRQLAEYLELPLTMDKKTEIVKSVITAIGFGCRATTREFSWRDQDGIYHYPSMSSIIKNPRARQHFLNHAWIKGFIEEQNIISRIIFDYVRDQVQDLDFLKNENGNISRTKVLAFLYHHEETALMNKLTGQFEESLLLLRVHDAFYTRAPINFRDVKEVLKNHNIWADINRSEHRAYGYNDLEQQHQQHIIEEELRANDGFIPQYILDNRRRIEKIIEQSTKKYQGQDEFDNGCRLESIYQPEFDPIQDYENI